MTFVLALLLLVAQETTTATTTAAPPPKPKPAESALVKAARAAKAKKLASTKKPITNADLKKAKSKLLVHEVPVTATDTTASTATTTTDTRGPLTKEDERYRARKAAEERVNVASAKVSDLEKEIDRVEQSYYNTNDPNERDTVIAKRFAQTRRQLEDARKELADARDALAALK